MTPIPFSPLQFVALLYRGATPPPGFVEIRYLPGGTRSWMPWPAFEGHPDEYHLTQAPAGKDVYLGVSLRTETGDYKGVGGAANCHPPHLVWTDIDLKDHPEFTGGQTDVLSMTTEELAEYKQAMLAMVLALCESRKLPPRAIVDSGHGLQVYWARRARSTPEDTERFNLGLLDVFGGDPKSYDVARILRLPGSRNLKNKARPLPVQVIWADAEAWVEDSALPVPTEPVTPPKAPTPAGPSRPPADGESVIESWNARHPIGEVLERYGYQREDGKTYTRPGDDASGRDVRLLQNKKGVLCSYHHSSNDPLAGHPSDKHLREPFDLFTEYEHGGDFKTAVRAASVELGLDKVSTKAAGTIGGKKKAVGERADPVDQISPRKPGPSVYTAHASYYIDRPIKKGGEVVDWFPEQLTNWTWEPSLKLRYPDGTFGQRGTLTIAGTDRHEIQIEAKVWGGRKDLLEVIGGYQAVCFTSSNSDIAKIGDYIRGSYPELPEARGVKSYGLHLHEGEWVELYEDQTISTGETPPLFYSGTPVDPGSRSFRSPKRAAESKIDEARRAIVRLMGLVTPTVALALLGYGAASAFSPRITPHLGNRLPFLFIAGERESGKTSGAQIVLELMTGYSARLTKASGMTPYQYDIAHSGANNMLSLLDEYRPGEIDDGQLRKHHDLGTKWRGAGMANKDLAYELNAPLVVLGEGFTDDAATKSRGVLYFVRKRDGGNVDAYSQLLKLPLWAYADHLHELARTTSEEDHLARYARASELAVGAAGADTNPRLRYALIYIAYGLLVLQEDVEPSAFRDADIAAALAEGAHNTLEGGTEGVTNLELFLEQLCFVLTKSPNPGMYVSPSTLAGDLIIRPKVCLDLVKQHYKEHTAIANPTLFKQYAEQASYFEDGDLHKNDQGQVIRGKRICLAQIPARCDADLLSDFNQQLRS
jgi:hypothetical protein